MKNISDKEKSPLGKLIEQEFPNCTFSAKVRKMAGKYLKKNQASAIEYLSQNKNTKSGAKIPVKCNILGWNRHPSEWPCALQNRKIQEIVFSMNQMERTESEPKALKASIEEWFKRTNAPDFGFQNTQMQNQMFSAAYSIYDGVVKKVANRNAKNKEKINRDNSYYKENGLPERIFVEESPFDEGGFLVQKPGINPDIRCVQQFQAQVLDISKEKDVELLSLFPDYVNYRLQPDAPIPLGVVNRLSIPEGEPGFVPPHHRSVLNLNKKRYRLSCRLKKTNALLLIIRIKEDWILIDGRGLLRNLCFRKLINRKEMTLQEVLEFFTDSPVIDTRRNIVTFMYKEDKINVFPVNGPISYKKAPELFLKEAPAKLISVDLGQRNILAAKCSNVNKIDGTLDVKFQKRTLLPNDLIDHFKNYRFKCDALEKIMLSQAAEKLTPEQQSEHSEYQMNSASVTKEQICVRWNLAHVDLPWDKMNKNSTFISDRLLEQKIDENEIYFETLAKGKKSKTSNRIKRTDYQWAKLFKKKLSDTTRVALNNAVWEIKRQSPEYYRLSQYKKQIINRAVNHLINWGKTDGLSVIFNIENLNSKNFHGSSKRESGWDGFFKSAKENRWFIQGFLTAIRALPGNKGLYVVESAAAYTSQTCPRCSHVESENRNENDFCCLKCKYTGHADLDIATDNLEKVAITGKGMSKPGERLGVAQKAGPARKTQTSEKKRKSQQEVDPGLSLIEQPTEALANQPLSR